MLCSLIIPKPAWERVFARLNRNFASTCLAPTNNHSLTYSKYFQTLIMCTFNDLWNPFLPHSFAYIPQTHSNKNLPEKSSQSSPLMLSGMPLSTRSLVFSVRYIQTPWPYSAKWIFQACSFRNSLAYKKRKAGIKMQFLFLTLWPTKILSAKKPAIP